MDSDASITGEGQGIGITSIGTGCSDIRNDPTEP